MKYWKNLLFHNERSKISFLRILRPQVYARFFRFKLVQNNLVKNFQLETPGARKHFLLHGLQWQIIACKKEASRSNSHLHISAIKWLRKKLWIPPEPTTFTFMIRLRFLFLFFSNFHWISQPWVLIFTFSVIKFLSLWIAITIDFWMIEVSFFVIEYWDLKRILKN